MSAFAAILERQDLTILDGGLATELEAEGHSLGGHLWSAELLFSDPDAIVTAHKSYLRAGAQILVTASYQASRAGFHQRGIDADEADLLIASSVALARRAIAEFKDESGQDVADILVAASIGPYGAVLSDGSEYTGDYGVPRQYLQDFHEQRLALLDASGADILACETIPAYDEAAVLAALLRDARTPAWVSFSCRNATEISDGTPIAAAAGLFRDHSQVLALGVNCTVPRYVVALLKAIAAAAPGKGLIAYPNSGEHYEAGDNSWSGQPDIRSFSAAAAEWRAAGADIIGGCCRVGPADIRALVESLTR